MKSLKRYGVPGAHTTKVEIADTKTQSPFHTHQADKHNALRASLVIASIATRPVFGGTRRVVDLACRVDQGIFIRQLVRPEAGFIDHFMLY